MWASSVKLLQISVSKQNTRFCSSTDHHCSFYSSRAFSTMVLFFERTRVATRCDLAGHTESNHWNEIETGKSLFDPHLRLSNVPMSLDRSRFVSYWNFFKKRPSTGYAIRKSKRRPTAVHSQRFLFSHVEHIINETVRLFSLGSILPEASSGRILPLHLVALIDPQANWFRTWMVSVSPCWRRDTLLGGIRVTDASTQIPISQIAGGSESSNDSNLFDISIRLIVS